MSASQSKARGAGDAGASQHQGQAEVWSRHSDFYVPRGQTPGLPGPSPSQEELRKGHWSKLRRLPSWPLLIFIKGWRRLISPLYGQVCAYYPSCSAYGLESVTAHGLLKGSGLTVWRILRCNPFSSGGLDPVPVSPRIWPQGAVPQIIETNHPPLDTE